VERVTLGTIAARLGLSKFAVSRALAGKSGVSEETRRRVETVAAELGYMRTAVPPPPPVIGLVFNDTDRINSELQLQVHAGVQAEAHRCGYQVRARWIHDAGEIESTMRASQAGILVGPHDKSVHGRLYRLGIPIVRTSGFPDPLEAVDLVTGPDHEAGAAVAQFLLRLGHREIAYVHGAPRYRGRIERLYGLREVLETHADARYSDLRFEPELTFAQSLEALHAAGRQPTAFFCAHDGLAVTVVSELLRLGYRIPEEVSVVGFGDFASATQIAPQLTTVTLPGQQMGACCVRLLDDRLTGRVPDGVPLRITVAGRIVERASSGPGPASDQLSARRSVAAAS
jgi:LacI family transcriptional regulator